MDSMFMRAIDFRKNTIKHSFALTTVPLLITDVIYFSLILCYKFICGRNLFFNYVFLQFLAQGEPEMGTCSSTVIQIITTVNSLLSLRH